MAPAATLYYLCSEDRTVVLLKSGQLGTQDDLPHSLYRSAQLFTSTAEASAARTKRMQKLRQMAAAAPGSKLTALGATPLIIAPVTFG